MLTRLCRLHAMLYLCSPNEDFGRPNDNMESNVRFHVETTFARLTHTGLSKPINEYITYCRVCKARKSLLNPAWVSLANVVSMWILFQYVQCISFAKCSLVRLGLCVDTAEMGRIRLQDPVHRICI